MRVRPLLPLLLAGLAPLLVAAQDAATLGGTQFAQVTIHERIIVRIPRGLAPARLPGAPSSPITWIEKKAEKCVAVASLAGATIAPGGDLDLLLNDGRRLRAKLDDDCPGMSFYSGFYLKRTADGKICADRDRIATRSGAKCSIERFRTLVAKR